MNKAARRYTIALYETAEELNLINATEKDFLQIKKTAETSREFMLFLKSPVINPVKKRRILITILSGKVSSLTIKFVELICSNNREGILYDISKDYLDLLNEKRGITETQIRTVVETNEQEKKILLAKLKKYTGNEIKAEFKIDKSLMGGFVAQMKDTTVDASVKRQLELMREQLKKGETSRV